MPRILHVLSQRPSLTGSGITLDALVRNARLSGWDQQVVVGVPWDDPTPSVGDLEAARVHPLMFGNDELPIPVPGMSDVMPYASTRFSSMTDGQIECYIAAWRGHLQRVIRRTSPDLIHSHHLWLVSSLLKDVDPDTPVVTQCHATGFRQMEFCPHLAEIVRRGCARNDCFLVLHEGHAVQLAETLGVSDDRIHVVGAGYREDLFHTAGRKTGPRPRLLYIGKYSAAKGLPLLLDAFESLTASGVDVELHIAGSGSGLEADQLKSRMLSLKPSLILHGQLPQEDLAALMRRCDVCVLPSLYEGLPLVLVEALACGCRLVATALPGIEEQLAPRFGDELHLVQPPPLVGIDTPDPSGLPAFTIRLRQALENALESRPEGDPPESHREALRPLSWRAVFDRIEVVWQKYLTKSAKS